MDLNHCTQNDRNWVANSRSRLAQRRAEKPATKAAQIRALWPDIEAALAKGQNMSTICRWLLEDAGITIGVTSLTSYVSRIRRRQRANRTSQMTTGFPIPPQRGSIEAYPEVRPRRLPDSSFAQPPEDPLASAMRALSRPKLDIRKIHNDGDPEGRNLI